MNVFLPIDRDKRNCKIHKRNWNKKARDTKSHKDTKRYRKKRKLMEACGKSTERDLKKKEQKMDIDRMGTNRL